MRKNKKDILDFFIHNISNKISLEASEKINEITKNASTTFKEKCFYNSSLITYLLVCGIGYQSSEIERSKNCILIMTTLTIIIFMMWQLSKLVTSLIVLWGKQRNTIPIVKQCLSNIVLSIKRGGRIFPSFKDGLKITFLELYDTKYRFVSKIHKGAHKIKIVKSREETFEQFYEKIIHGIKENSYIYIIKYSRLVIMYSFIIVATRYVVIKGLFNSTLLNMILESTTIIIGRI